MEANLINPFLSLDPKDVLSVTKALVELASLSHQEQEICDSLSEWILNVRPDADLERVSNTLAVKINHSTLSSGELPVILAGHLDTVPSAKFDGQTNATPRIVQDKLYGLGTSDMKSGLAVMIALLADIEIPSTFIFYEAEEVAEKFNGLRLLRDSKPELMQGKWAILLEPTNGQLEMGCQGALRAHARFVGKRAHSARPWMGENAIHKGAKTLEKASKIAQSLVEVELEGLTYTPTLQVTMIEGGVAANVIPDALDITINHRFTPDIDGEVATEFVRDLCSDADEFEVTSIANGAVPAMDHPLVQFGKSRGKKLVPKVAWTDVARFYALGIPALNCGPGDATLCHTPGEYVEISKIEETYNFLKEFIGELD